MMRRTPWPRAAQAGVAVLVVLGWACGGGGTGPDSGNGGGLSLTPTSASLHHPGDTIRLTAGSASIQWTTSDPGVATVSAEGLVSATGYGSATITARAADAQAQALVRVLGETSMAFLEGTWLTENEQAPVGLADDGVLVVGRNQGALRAVWRGTLDDVDVEAVSLVVRRGTGWTVARADGVRGTFAVLDGTPSPGRIALTSGTKLGDTLAERVVFSDFTSTSLRMSIDESDDGGGTWTPVWIRRLTRGAPRVTPPVLSTPSPACAAPEYAQFDFWLGDWTVTVPSGGVAGTNVIHPVAGCGIQENWRDASSGGGISLNMFDPRSERWAQFYVASTGGSIELYGTLLGGRMVLEGTAGSIRDRVTWSPSDDGAVRQHWERASGNGGFSTFFDGLYRPR